MGMRGSGRIAEHCKNTTSALSVAHSCLQRNLQGTLGRTTPSHAQPNSAGEKLSFTSTNTIIAAQKGHEIEGMKANGIGIQLLEEINSSVLSIATARGHSELAATEREEVFRSQPAHCQHSSTHMFDEGGENCICLAEASQQRVHTAPCRQCCLYQLVINCQQSSQLQNYTFLQSLDLV